MILAALAILAQSGTIAIPGGLCPSAVAISLPAPDPGMTRVHLSVAVEHVFTHESAPTPSRMPGRVSELQASSASARGRKA